MAIMSNYLMRFSSVGQFVVFLLLDIDLLFCNLIVICCYAEGSLISICTILIFSILHDVVHLGFCEYRIFLDWIYN